MSVILRRINSGAYQTKVPAPGKEPSKPVLGFNPSVAELLVHTNAMAAHEVNHRAWVVASRAHFDDQAALMEKLRVDREDPRLCDDDLLRDHVETSRGIWATTTDVKLKAMLAADLRKYEPLLP